VITADPNSDAVYMVWAGHQERMNWALQGDRTERANIFLRASEDGGKTWSDRRVVNDDATKGVNHLLPGASVAPNGRLDIAWHDYRLSQKPPDIPGRDLGMQDIFYTYSEDNGRTFAPNAWISDRSIDRSVGVWSNNIGSQINVGIASAEEGAYFAWSDRSERQHPHTGRRRLRSHRAAQWVSPLGCRTHLLIGSPRPASNLW